MVGYGVLAVVLGFGALAEVPLRLGIEALADGDTDRAADRFATARALRPWDLDVDTVVGHAYAAAATARTADAAERARRHATRALQRLPDSVEVRADLASAYEALGDFTTAARYLDEALRRDPYNTHLLLQRGVVAARANDPGTAERLFLRVADLRPDSPAPWRNLERLYREQQRAADTARAAARATELEGR